MRKCAVCNKRRVFKASYYFCSKCFNKYKNEKWLKKFERFVKRQEYRDRIERSNTLGFDDLIWVGGRKRKIEETGEEVWVDGEIKRVGDILDKQIVREYLLNNS